MSPKKVKFLICPIAFILLVAFFDFALGAFSTEKQLMVQYQVEQADVFQAFFKVTDNEEYSEENSLLTAVPAQGVPERLTLDLPDDAVFSCFRLDFGAVPENVFSVFYIQVRDGRLVYELGPEELWKLYDSGKLVPLNIHFVARNERSVMFQADTDDPSLEFPMQEIQAVVTPERAPVSTRVILLNGLSIVLSALIIWAVWKIVSRRDLAQLAKEFVSFFVDIVRERSILWGLAKNDLKAKFASSMLGVIWAFIQPLVTVLVFWFVFQVGFRNPPVQNVPFIVWFLPAYLVWAFFSEALVSGTNCLMEYNYLVKKINFRVSMIPVVKILSSAFVHMSFILFILLVLIVYRVPVTVYSVQVIYYFLCCCILLLGLCWLLAAMAPFVKDTTNIISVFIQIGFWLTPIFWSPDTMTPWVQTLLKLNPMFYICQGYRDSFVDHIWFWQRGPYQNMVFWIEAMAVFVAGAYLFNKLRPQFADVL